MAVGLIPALKKICKRQNSPPPPSLFKLLGQWIGHFFWKQSHNMHIPAESTGPEMSETKAERLGPAPPWMPGGGRKRHPHCGALRHRWSIGLPPTLSISIFRRSLVCGLPMGTGFCAMGRGPGMEAGGKNLPEPFFWMPPHPVPWGSVDSRQLLVRVLSGSFFSRAS